MPYTHFSRAERLELSILRTKGYSFRAIAKALKRNPSSVSRELQRNKVKGQYDAVKAHRKTVVRRTYSKYQGMKVVGNKPLRNYVERKLKKTWSPESIAGRWRRDTGEVVHHDAIYKYLYSAYGQSLCPYLRYKQYHVKKRVATKSPKVLIPHRTGIEERPEVINQRLRFGDLEGDTMGVPQGSRVTIAAIVERQSRFIMGEKIANLKVAMDSFKMMREQLPAKSCTFDNGIENRRHEELGIPTYFCHRYASWEKVSVEYAFKLIREFIPKKAYVGNYSAEEIRGIIDTINRRPRKCLGFRTPLEVFKEQVISARRCT